MNDDAIDKLLSALAHSGRRRMIDLLMAAPGMTVGALASHFAMSRIAVLNHLKVLEQAELLLSKKVGRSRHLYFNPVPIQLIHDRWTTKFSAFWTERMVDIKSTIESRNAKNKDWKSA